MLSQEEKYSEFTMKIRSLLTEGQKVDKFFAIETIEVGEIAKEGGRSQHRSPLILLKCRRIFSSPRTLSSNRLSPGGGTLQRLTGRKQTHRTLRFVSPSVSLSCDKDPETILQHVRPKWRRQGDN